MSEFELRPGQDAFTDLSADYLGRSADLHCIVRASDLAFLWLAGAWGEMLGWVPGELATASLAQLVHAEDRDALTVRLREAEGSPGEHLGRLRTSTGGFRWVAWTGRLDPIADRLYLGGRNADDRVRQSTIESRRLSSANHAATHDPLTGLANRSLLLDHTQRAIARSNRTGVEPLVMFIDLNDFKRINDELGHARGDEALRTVAARLQAAFRPSDVVARYGGDEFVVVLEGGDSETARRRAENAIVDPLRLGDHEYRLSAAIGTASITDPRVDPEAAIAAADRDMYRRKRAAGDGRG